MTSLGEKPPTYSLSRSGTTHENRIVSASFWSRHCCSSRVTVAHLTIIFLVALAITVIRHIRSDNVDALATFLTLPEDADRFETPWRIPHRVKLLSVTEARHRILYSPLRTQAGEGLGYYIRTVSAEVGTAMRLGIAYSHRHSKYGSLDAQAVDNLFNLSEGHIPRRTIRENVCSIRLNIKASSPDANSSGSEIKGEESSEYDNKCDRCGSNGFPAKRPNLLGIERIVDLPRNLTYDWSSQDEFGRSGRTKIAKFLSQIKHRQPYTLFQMPMGDCERRIAAQFVGPDITSYLFHRYWDAHGGAIHLSRFQLAIPSALNDSQNKYGRKGRPNLGFSTRELHIAIHARRGDFFKHNRPRVAVKTYAEVLEDVMEIVHDTGGPYSSMKAVVRVYSEGIPLLEHSSLSSMSVHNMSRRTSRFQDADGAEMGYDTVQGLLLGQEDEDRRRRFPHGARVEMRVSKDTVRSVHEMVAADVFIGSESTLGSVVVQTLSRGALILLPLRAGMRPKDTGQWRHGLRSYFDADSGRLLERRRVRRGWRTYVAYTQAGADGAEESV